jgi:hypothetical protein
MHAGRTRQGVLSDTVSSLVQHASAGPLILMGLRLGLGVGLGSGLGLGLGL